MLADVRPRLAALAAAAVAVEFWVELAVIVPAGTPYRALAAVLLGATAIAVVFGSRAPLAAVAVSFGTVALLTALTRVYYDELLLPFVAPFVCSYWLGRYAGQRALLAGLALAIPAGLAATVPYARESAITSGLFTLVVTLGAPVLIGRVLRGRAALHAALREKAELLERRSEVAAGRAVADERTRIAGEMHDVVAHALSAMTVQATGARRLTLRRPDSARAAFEAIETAGREALDELRRLLGVLRREDAQLTLAPQPSLRHTESLVRRTTAGGLPVTLHVEGEPRELSAGVDVTAYRVAQESLAAARDVGGAGRAELRLRYRADALDVEVRDDGPLLGPRPLMGIRERVQVHGGRLVTGRRRSGGHTVRATLPLDGHALAREEPAERPCAVRRERALRRLRRHHGLVDALIAAVAALAGVTEVLVMSDRSGPLVANVLVALAYTVPLAWRRRAPLAVAAAVVAATLLMGLALSPLENLFVPLAALLASAYACGAHRDGREAIAGLLLVALALPALTATMDDRVPADYVFPSLLVAVAWLAGRAVRARTRLAAELHEAAARVAEATEEAQRVAATEERRRIAREMHDLVAHSMSVMVVQAGGARRILDRDPARALEAATKIERTGREALGEMRHLLGMLNGADHAPALAPQPTLGEVGELVTRARSAGLPTVLEFRGERRSLPAGLDLAAYRIVQEGLTNALKHAGRAPTTVTVDWSDEVLTLEIRDHGSAGARDGSAGHGLVGMRERVRLYGGEIEAGPADGGGWRVRAVLPLGEREPLAVPAGADA